MIQKLRIVLVCGKHNSGKTTFCQHAIDDLSDHVPISGILVGEILREAAKNQMNISEHVNLGTKVPDEIILGKIWEKFNSNAINLLDNFPQSEESLQNLDRMLRVKLNTSPAYCLIEMNRHQEADNNESNKFKINRNKDYFQTILPMIAALQNKGILHLKCTGYQRDPFGSFILSDINFKKLPNRSE